MRRYIRPVLNRLRESQRLNAIANRFGLYGLGRAETTQADLDKYSRAQAAALRANGLTGVDLALLDDAELDAAPISPAPRQPRLYDSRSPQFVNRLSEEGKGEAGRYLDPRSAPVATDSSLSPPPLVSEWRRGAVPKVSITAAPWSGAGVRLHHFEFDTSPDFRSPNLWRYPALLNTIEGENLCDERDLSYYVMTSRTRGNRNGEALTVEFPFPAAAMRLPHERDQIGFGDVEKLAGGFRGIKSKARIVDAVFRFVQAKFAWSNDTCFRPPTDVVRAGMGGCGHINILAGLLLELNGIRCRVVAGFDPTLRQIYPGAGHTAIEFLNGETDRWEYLDPYLDVRLPGRAAADLPTDREARSVCLAAIDKQFDRSRYGEFIDLGRIFRYRFYLDFADRLPMANMLQVHGREDEYGRCWRLVRSRLRMPRSLQTRPIHVRARYIFAETGMSDLHPVLLRPPLASRWSYGRMDPSWFR